MHQTIEEVLSIHTSFLFSVYCDGFANVCASLRFSFQDRLRFTVCKIDCDPLTFWSLIYTTMNQSASQRGQSMAVLILYIAASARLLLVLITSILMSHYTSGPRS